MFRRADCCSENTHNVTGIFGYQYLRLVSPTSATPQQIVKAIDNKCGPNPTSAQFSTMMTICNALNNVSI